MHGSAPIRLWHPQGDPGKRGRGEREAKGLFIFKMFYNGIISSQEVFRIDSVRNRFHFSSAEMRWESSLWCEPLQSSENHRSEKLPAHWKDALGSPQPHAPHIRLLLHLQHNSAVPSIQAAALREQLLCWGQLCPAQGGEKKPFFKKSPLFPRTTFFFLGILTFSQHGFHCLPSWHPAPGTRWPFHCSGEESAGIFKSPGKNLVGGGEGVLQAPIQKWSL